MIDNKLIGEFIIDTMIESILLFKNSLYSLIKIIIIGPKGAFIF